MKSDPSKHEVAIFQLYLSAGVKIGDGLSESPWSSCSPTDKIGLTKVWSGTEWTTTGADPIGRCRRHFHVRHERTTRTTPEQTFMYRQLVVRPLEQVDTRDQVTGGFVVV